MCVSFLSWLRNSRQRKRTAVVTEWKDLKCIKRDATESKISKKFDYFSNKIPECLPKNKFLSKSKQIVKNSFEIGNLDQILIPGGSK